MQASVSRDNSLTMRARKFLSQPWPEKVFAACYRIKMSFPGFPVPFRLPFGSWWLIRKGALDHDILSGNFERAELQFVRKFLRPGMTVLDIGAHHGLYTLLASRCVGRGGHVYAFEPSPRERSRLRAHVWLNRCSNVKIVPLALGAQDADAELFVVRGAQTGCNSLRPPAVNEPTARVRVKQVTLDGFLRARGLESVDFVKMDVEGAELSVLRGAERLLRAERRPVILAEVEDVRTEPWGYQAREIVMLLDSEGYEWFQPLEDGSLAAIGPGRRKYEPNLVAIPKERREEVFSRLGSEC